MPELSNGCTKSVFTRTLFVRSLVMAVQCHCVLGHFLRPLVMAVQRECVLGQKSSVWACLIQPAKSALAVLLLYIVCCCCICVVVLCVCVCVVCVCVCVCVVARTPHSQPHSKALLRRFIRYIGLLMIHISPRFADVLHSFKVRFSPDKPLIEKKMLIQLSSGLACENPK